MDVKVAATFCWQRSSFVFAFHAEDPFLLVESLFWKLVLFYFKATQRPRPCLTGLYRVSFDLSFLFLQVKDGVRPFNAVLRDWIGLKKNWHPQRFHQVLEGLRQPFFKVLLGFTGFYQVLLGFKRFYWVLPNNTGSYWVFTGFYWVLLSFTKIYWA